MSSHRKVNSATGFDGKKIFRADKVISIYGVIATIEDMWHQGRDGTIIKTDIAPDPEFPNHRSGDAKRMFRKHI